MHRVEDAVSGEHRGHSTTTTRPMAAVTTAGIAFCTPSPALAWHPSAPIISATLVEGAVLTAGPGVERHDDHRGLPARGQRVVEPWFQSAAAADRAVLVDDGGDTGRHAVVAEVVSAARPRYARRDGLSV